MPPTNYIWMKTNMKDELVGIYEWINGQWRRIYIAGDDSGYTKCEVDILLQYTEQEILQKIRCGEYDIGSLTVDDELSFLSVNPVQNRVVTAELAAKLDKLDFEIFKASIPQIAGLKYGTTEEWNNQIGYIPVPGEIIIYSDYRTKEVDGQIVNIPGIKIGSGNAFVQDLAFLDEDIAGDLYNHIANSVMHVTQEEKDRWNNKLNVDDNAEVINGSLTFNRN